MIPSIFPNTLISLSGGHDHLKPLSFSYGLTNIIRIYKEIEKEAHND